MPDNHAVDKHSVYHSEQLNIALDDYTEIKKYYKYLSCNCCFRLGHTNSKQVTDIPVGSDGPRPLSDLFFYHYENK